MRIRWLGHAAFLLTASDGTRIITDPYVPGSFSGQIKYGPIREACDAVTVSHHHQDHDGVARLPAKPAAIEGRGVFKVKSVSVTGFDTFHDTNQGRERGKNTVFVFEADGLRVCHCGDLGHVLTPEQVAAIGKVDVLLVPVGGTFTVAAEEAQKVALQVSARVTIPMHFKTPKLGFDVAGIEGFTWGKPNVKQLGAAEVELSTENLPAAPEIWVLEHAL